MRSALRRVARECAIFALYLLLAIAVTWPLARTMRTAVSDLGDPLLNTWILDWVCHALVHQPLDLFQAPMYYPARLPLAMSENLLGIAIPLLPLHLAGVAPVTLYNVAMLLGFTLSGYGAFVLARMVTSSTLAALLAGFVYAFLPFKFDHLAHLQIVSSGWVPLILAGLIAYWRKPSWTRALLFGGAFLMNGLTNVYFLLFTAVTVALSLLFYLFAGPARDLRFWLRLAVALGLAGAILLPVLLPYKQVSELYGMKRPREEIAGASGEWSDWLRVTSRSRTYGDLIPPDRHKSEHELFPGMFVLVLAGAGFLLTRAVPRDPEATTGRPVSRRLLALLDTLIVLSVLATVAGAMSEPRFVLRLFGRTVAAVRGSDLPAWMAILLVAARCSLRMPAAMGGDRGRTLRDVVAGSRFPVEFWAGTIWIVSGLLGSLGLKTFFYTFLFERVEAYQSMRAPGRWAIVAYAGLVLWSAAGAAALLRRRGRGAAIAMSVALPLLAWFDLRADIQWEQAPERPAPVYRWLRTAGAGPVLEWPFGGWQPFHYLLGSTHHRVPLMNGTSGWEPPVHRELRMAWEEKRYAAVVDLAEKNGCAILVVHAHGMEESDPALVSATLREALAGNRLAFLRRFEHGVEGDYVFAVTKNLPRYEALRAPDTPDGAGHLRATVLERYLNGQTNFNGLPFGRLESPSWEVTGPLVVRGWAFASNQIRRVDVLLDEGSYRYEARRLPRPEVSALWPWYYEQSPGFELVIPRRPRGVPENTDVQVEIEDSTGYRVRLDDRPFSWKAAEERPRP